MDALHVNDVVCAFVAEAFNLHPYHNPPEISIIAGYLRDNLKTDLIEIVDVYEAQKVLKSVLMGCIQFRQLNISAHRWMLGQRDIYDEGFETTKSANPLDNDYIDLDAIVQNTIYRLNVYFKANQDCFLCEHSSEYGSINPSDCDECAHCTNNPNYRCNFKYHRYALLSRDSDEYKYLVATGRISGMI